MSGLRLGLGFRVRVGRVRDRLSRVRVSSIRVRVRLKG